MSTAHCRKFEPLGFHKRCRAASPDIGLGGGVATWQW